MDHPVRTLLYELFVEPSVRLLRRLFQRSLNSRPTKDHIRKAVWRTTRHQRSSPTQRPTSGAGCCWAMRSC